MVKLALIGAGRIGKLHAENIVYGIHEAQLVMIADTLLNGDMEQWARGLGVSKVTRNAEEIFTDPSVDAVLICSPSPTHEEYIMKAAHNGKHIFCEKPIGSDVAKIRQALQVVEENKVKLQVGFVRRFDHNHRRVRDAVRNGEIGEPYLLKITSRDPQLPSMEYLRSSGGIFFDMTIHDFDMARYLAGSDVEEVFAHATVCIEPAIKEFGDFDTAITTMKFKNGMLGVIDNCRQASYGYDQRTEVHGSKGCVLVENDRPNTAMICTASGTYGERFLWFFTERYRESFVAELCAFIQTLENNTEVPVTGIDGLKAVLIAQAADKSAREGRPVKIAEI